MEEPLHIKKWVFSPHVVKRMEERKISAETIENVLISPDDKISQGPKWIFIKKIKGRSDNDLAAVILERKESKLWVVITVMINFKKR